MEMNFPHQQSIDTFDPAEHDPVANFGALQHLISCAVNRQLASPSAKMYLATDNYLSADSTVKKSIILAERIALFAGLTDRNNMVETTVKGRVAGHFWPDIADHRQKIDDG